MGFLKNMNERVKGFNIVDIKLAQGAAMFVALVIVKLIPRIMSINIWWFVALLVVCAIRPMYVFFIKR